MKTFEEFLNESQEVLNKISSAWERKHPGMKFAVYKSNLGDIQVHSIEVPKNLRGKGIGTRAMRGLSHYADKNDSRITLSPEGEKTRLNKWYKSLGFKPNKNRNKDFRVRDSMIRNPKT